MSTFKGIVEEFPLIRIDFFRKNPDRPPPLACFLSHVHSDHLLGLETLRSPFVYCSAATKEILLRIEKYPHRMNFSKGILETRKQHYRHLLNILRPIPLQVPTEIELTPRNRIRVTLFDANHCIGAVMFLIEGNSKAILYTGDIRAEAWWVNSLVRNPVLIPYTLGNKRLDRVYLDTTFATKSNIYKTFPSKAEGIRELLQKIDKYPKDTVFYLRSWTFGYEEVWLALSAALNTPIHVDPYQLGLYKSLSVNYGRGFGIHEAPYLYGFTLGNSPVPGCLTGNQDSRVHSCEPGMFCSVISTRPSVFISPIVNRTADGSEVPEHGVGGGGGDLYQSHELELTDELTLQQLETLCREQIKDEKVLSKTLDVLSSAFNSETKTLSLDKYGLKVEDDIPLKDLVFRLSRGKSEAVKDLDAPLLPVASSGKKERFGGLPKSIKFPYSRHSSYDELHNLVEAFRPKDLFPCTVDEATWRDEVSMQNLFGHLCSGKAFTHDKHMREIIMDEDWERPKKRQKQTPEPDSIPRADETQSREIQSTSQSFATTEATDSQPMKLEEHARSSNLAEPHTLPNRGNIRVLNSPEQQVHTERDIEPARATISSSPCSSLSSPHLAKHQAILQVLRGHGSKKEINNQPITQPQKSLSPSPVRQPREDVDDETKDEIEREEGEKGDEEQRATSIAQQPEEDAGDETETETEGEEEEEEEEEEGVGKEAISIKPESKQIDIIEISDDETPSNNLNDTQDESHDHGGDNWPKTESQSSMVSYSVFGSQHSSQPRVTITSPRSLRRRAEACNAARSGTFSDWANYAPISSGNNHTKMEIDL